MKPNLQAFFDAATWTVTYVVDDGAAAAVIDSVLDYDPKSGRTRNGVSEDEFVAMRTARDRTLDMPTLILPSIQVNIRAGEMPPPEADGRSYLKIPLNAL